MKFHCSSGVKLSMMIQFGFSGIMIQDAMSPPTRHSHTQKLGFYFSPYMGKRFEQVRTQEHHKSYNLRSLECSDLTVNQSELNRLWVKLCWILCYTIACF